MKRITLALAIAAALSGCSDSAAQPPVQETATTSPAAQPTETLLDVKSIAGKDEATVNQLLGKPTVQEKPGTTQEQEQKKDEPKIDTSKFIYAESVEVTDAREISKHLNLVVRMSEDVGAGSAVQSVLIQTYDFLQQQDIKGAETVTIGIMQGDLRVYQFTTNLKKFKAGENLITSVLQASTVDKTSDEIEEFGKSTGLW